MHRRIVDEPWWIGEGPFLMVLNFLHTDPEAQQLVTTPVGAAHWSPRFAFFFHSGKAL
jgi:mannose-6-phosphate isomerase-like protein (cupin superfamily)